MSFYLKLFSMFHCSHAIACIKNPSQVSYFFIQPFILHEIVINSSKKHEKFLSWFAIFTLSSSYLFFCILWTSYHFITSTKKITCSSMNSRRRIKFIFPFKVGSLKNLISIPCGYFFPIYSSNIRGKKLKREEWKKRMMGI